MESSSRMRRCVRRNYEGSDHFGAAANFEDPIKTKEQENVISSSNAPILAAEAIAVEAVNEDDEQGEIENMDGRPYGIEESGENHSRLSETAEKSLLAPAESDDTQVAGEPGLVQSSSPIAAGYVPSELDERIVLELPSSMVRPLRVISGTFQASLTLLTCDILLIQSMCVFQFLLYLNLLSVSYDLKSLSFLH